MGILIGIYITFNDILYIGYEDADNLAETQKIISEEVGKTSRYFLKNTKDGDIMFPLNALRVADIKLTKIHEDEHE